MRLKAKAPKSVSDGHGRDAIACVRILQAQIARYFLARQTPARCVPHRTHRVQSAHVTIIDPMALQPAPAQRTMGHWLGLVMREHREREGFKASRVAGLCDADQSTVTRFEKGVHWPGHIDQILAAYAQVLNVEDPRLFYAQALDRWHEEGEAPVIEPDPTRAARAASAAAAARTKRRRAG